jgi:hypothetical protein
VFPNNQTQPNSRKEKEHIPNPPKKREQQPHFPAERKQRRLPKQRQKLDHEAHNIIKQIQKIPVEKAVTTQIVLLSHSEPKAQTLTHIRKHGKNPANHRRPVAQQAGDAPVSRVRPDEEVYSGEEALCEGCAYFAGL